VFVTVSVVLVGRNHGSVIRDTCFHNSQKFGSVLKSYELAGDEVAATTLIVLEGMPYRPRKPIKLAKITAL